MKILQQAVKLKRNSRINITFSRPANIYLMTEVNFKRYKEGASFRRLGGWYDKSPAEFVAPYDGTWHAVIEKGAHVNPKPITGSVEVLPPLLKESDYLSDDWNSDSESSSTEQEKNSVEESSDENSNDNDETESEDDSEEEEK